MMRNRTRAVALALAAALATSGTALATATAEGGRSLAASPWSVYPVEVLPAAGITDRLDDVEAASADLAFAVGQSENDPLLVKWDGVSWKEVQFFPPYEADSALVKVHRASPTTWWAVGYSGKNPWIARYRNGAWSHFSTSGLAYNNPVAISTTSSGIPVVLTGPCCSTAGDTARVARWTGTRWVLQNLPRPAGYKFSEAAEISRIPGTSDRFVIIGSTSGPIGDRWSSRAWSVRGKPGGTWDDFSPPAAFKPFEPGFVSTYIQGSDAYAASRSDITYVGSIVTEDDAIIPGEDLPYYESYATRWNGTRWTRIKLPTVHGDALSAIAVQPGKSRMIVGFNASTRNGIAWEYKPGGSGWARLVSTPKDSGLLGLSAIPGTAQFWAVGFKGPGGGLYYSPSDPYVLKH